MKKYSLYRSDTTASEGTSNVGRGNIEKKKKTFVTHDFFVETVKKNLGRKDIKP